MVPAGQSLQAVLLSALEILPLTHWLHLLLLLPALAFPFEHFRHLFSKLNIIPTTLQTQMSLKEFLKWANKEETVQTFNRVKEINTVSDLNVNLSENRSSEYNFAFQIPSGIKYIVSLTSHAFGAARPHGGLYLVIYNHTLETHQLEDKIHNIRKLRYKNDLKNSYVL